MLRIFSAGILLNMRIMLFLTASPFFYAKMSVVAHSVSLLLVVRKHHCRGFFAVSPLFLLPALDCKCKIRFLRRRVRRKKLFARSGVSQTGQRPVKAWSAAISP